MDKKILITFVSLYLSILVTNQLWLLGEGKQIYLPAIGEYKNMDWYIYFINKGYVMSVFIFGSILSLKVKNESYKALMAWISKCFLVFVLCNTALFIFYYKTKNRDIAYQMIIAGLFLGYLLIDFFVRRKGNL